MADISKIIATDGTTYNVKDATARSEVETLRAAVGSPLMAAAKDSMTNENKIYVYTGSESGMTNGNWYFYDGSAWVSGGVYNAVAINTDTTLTVSGQAADAKITGDAIDEVKSYVDDIAPGLSDDAKIALLTCFQHVVWADDKGQTYYNALEDAIYSDPSPSLVSISAVFSQGSFEVYVDTPLDELRPYLVVTAHYSNGTSHSVSDYLLSGNLEVGTSTVVVSKNNKTTTFEVTVTQEPNLLYKIPSALTLNGTSDYLDTNFKLMKTKQSFTIVTSFVDDNGVFANNQNATLYHCMVENDAEGKYPGVSLHFTCYQSGSQTKIMQFSYNGNSNNDTRSAYFDTIPNTSLGSARAVFVYNATNNKMSAYTKIGGTVYSDTKTAGTFYSIDNTLLIGAYRTFEDVKGRFFKGTINELKIYDYAFDETAAMAYVEEG
jgi:hypothetical protein